ncbi:MAG: tyrosine-type recombinase/integrase [Methylophilaceae bacterium]|nr:tyrosine-type recombinase/integrase [Methylophilaceae bacterium]
MPKLAATLTDVSVRNKKPKDKPYKVAAGRGLHLLIKPTGAKFWVFRYRFEGKENSLSMGRYPDVSLAGAEEKVRDAHKSIAEGIDPSDKRKDIKAEKEANTKNTFEIWADKWWQNWHKDKSPRHANYVMRRLEADIFPSIGKLPINEIQAHEVVDTIKKIASRGALDIAKRAHQMMGQVFRYAIAHNKDSKTTRNPTTDIKPSDIIESRQKKNYARVELKELPALLRALDASNSQPLTRLAVKLMGLTFVRTTELIEAKWEEVDFDSKQWRIPAERMKMKTPHIVPLSMQALQTLQALHAISGSYDYIFPNQTNHTKTMSNNTILKALDVVGYKHKMTGHGFRGLASTALHEQGFDHQHIELQLAHQERNQVSASYNHALYLKQRSVMMQKWADYLDELKVNKE